MNQIIREAWVAVGKFWHREQRPRHFTTRGAKEYGYAPRKGEAGNPHPKGFWASYTGRKVRQFGHRRPLEYTGELRRMTRARRIVTTATSNRSTLRIQMPQARKANLRHPKSKINMREELTTVSRRDAEADVKVHNDFMNTRLRLFRGRKAKKL